MRGKWATVRRLRQGARVESGCGDGKPTYLVNGFGGYAGGIVRVHNALCRELSRVGTVSVSSAPLDQEDISGVRIVSRQSGSRRASLMRDIRSSWPPSKFDVRIDSAPAFRLLTRSARRVVVVHDLNFTDRHRHQISLAQYVYRRLLHSWTLPRADLIVANSQATRSEIAGLIPRLAGAVLVLPLPVDHAAALTPRKRWGRREVAITHVMTFGHARNKGVEHLIRLMAQRADIRLTLICGQSHWEEFWAAEAVSLGVADRVFVESDLDDEALYSQYASTDVFCMLSGYEGFGLPVAEALKLATPTVISEFPVLSEASRGHAITVDPGDYRELSGAIDRAIETPQATWELAATEFTDWTWERWTAAILEGVP